MNRETMLALELTKLYVEKCVGIEQTRIYEVFNYYYEQFTQKQQTENSIKDLQLELGEATITLDRIKNLMSGERNFIYKQEIEKILGDNND